jgi:hypothetical protein
VQLLTVTAGDRDARRAPVIAEVHGAVHDPIPALKVSSVQAKLK